MIVRCYPEGKQKAFNITYDDGILQDVRFVALLNKYGLKGTFNLNSALMEQKFEWIHETGMTVKRLGVAAVRHLYDGHEIASHTLTHPYLQDKTEEQLMWEIGEDKRRLEALFGREVAGFGVPFDYYDETIARCVQRCGFTYGRRHAVILPGRILISGGVVFFTLHRNWITMWIRFLVRGKNWRFARSLVTVMIWMRRIFGVKWRIFSAGFRKIPRSYP